MDRPRVDHALGPSGTSTRYKIGLALTLTPDFDSGIDRSLQEIIDLVFFNYWPQQSGLVQQPP
jgi:hypothetical protein